MSRRARVAAIVSVGVFVASLDLFIVNIAFPDIQRDFTGTSLASLSWVLNAYAIVFAALLVPAGRWADRTGRKRAFLGGLALFTLASAACAAAPSIGVLIAARVVQAAGAAVLMPASLGLLLPEFPPEKRGLAIGLWAAVGGTAAAAGPVIGGLLVELSWRWVFLVNIPIGIAAIVAGARVLHEIREEGAERPDLVGAGLLTAAVATLIGGIIEGPDWGWADGRVLGLFAVALVLSVAFVVRSGRHPVPVVEPALVKVRAFAAANIAGVFFFIGFSAMLLGSVLWLTEVWGETALGAGLKIAPGPSMAALFAVGGGILSGRIGPRAVGAVGAAALRPRRRVVGDAPRSDGALRQRLPSRNADRRRRRGLRESGVGRRGDGAAAADAAGDRQRRADDVAPAGLGARRRAAGRGARDAVAGRGRRHLRRRLVDDGGRRRRLGRGVHVRRPAEGARGQRRGRDRSRRRVDGTGGSAGLTTDRPTHHAGPDALAHRLLGRPHARDHRQRDADRPGADARDHER